jgi:hypothetical protein
MQHNCLNLQMYSSLVGGEVYSFNIYQQEFCPKMLKL